MDIDAIDYVLSCVIEICDNGIDDDGDGLTDCDDPDCSPAFDDAGEIPRSASFPPRLM